jgi:hypothetical protein
LLPPQTSATSQPPGAGRPAHGVRRRNHVCGTEDAADRVAELGGLIRWSTDRIPPGPRHSVPSGLAVTGCSSRRDRRDRRSPPHAVCTRRRPPPGQPDCPRPSRAGRRGDHRRCRR